jgi:hypothetical protein
MPRLDLMLDAQLIMRWAHDERRLPTAMTLATQYAFQGREWAKSK